jgi:hypothetical protein
MTCWIQQNFNGLPFFDHGAILPWACVTSLAGADARGRFSLGG